MGPLDGVHVLDITHVMAGAYCGMLLADMGADVVKVEPPTGDSTRGFGGASGTSPQAPFVAVNRNKRSLAIDLRDNAGASVLRRLALQADVIVENYRPGTLTRRGLGYEDLRKDNPALVYCSISGFGNTGPYSDRGGFDLVAQGMSGLMSVTGVPGGEPVKVGVPIADLNAGLFGAYGIVSAYVHRLKTGRGQYVDTSLLEAAIAYTSWESNEWFATGRTPQPTGSAHRLSAPYEAVPTADGYVIVGAANQGTWERLAGAIGREDLLTDERFAKPGARLSNRRELAAILADTFAGDTTDKWVRRLLDAGVPSGPINTIDQMLQDPHVLDRGMLVELGGQRHIGPPVKMSETPAAIRRPAAKLGEHSVQVLREYGIPEDEIDGLAARGVVVTQEGHSGDADT